MEWTVLVSFVTQKYEHNIYYPSSREFLKAGKKRLAGDIIGEATNERNLGGSVNLKPPAYKEHDRMGGQCMRYSTS